MALFTEILAGLIAIPKLIDRIDQFLGQMEAAKKEQWQKESIELERKLEAAETKEQIRELAKELQSLISRS